MDIKRRVEGSTWNWPLLVSVVFLNVCLPSLVYTYGVLLVNLANLGVPVWLGLSTPTISLLTYSLTQCWCRDAADSWGGTIGYRVLAIMGLMFVVLSLLLCAFLPYNFHPYVFGIFGGFGSSLLSAQVDAVIFDTYDTNFGTIRGLCFAGQAIGQSVFPHLITFLIDYYGYSYSFIVLSGIILQTLPVVMLLKIDETIKKRPISYIDKTYAIFNNDIIENGYTNELQLHDLGKKSWKSPSDDNAHQEAIVSDLHADISEYDDENNATITPPPSPEEKRRNIFGVEILPEIPEESEESDDNESNINEKNKNKLNKKRLSSAIKRLSVLGDSFDEYISKQVRRDSQADRDSISREYTEIEVTYDNISPVTDIQREKVFNSFNFRCQAAYTSLRRKMRVPSYRIYRLKRRIIYITSSINDTFIKPLTRSLSCWRFYLALILCFSKLSITAISLVLMPVVASQMKPKISMTDINILYSLHGFTWLCFLLCTPWLTQTPKRNFKYVTVLGLIISSGGCFLLARAKTYDLLSIGCVIGGFGFGAISSCWETAVQDFVGMRKWPKVNSTMETCSGILLFVFYLGILFLVDEEDGLQCALLILSAVLTGVTFMWTILAVVSLYLTKVRSLRPGRRCMF
ncbi:uncharacterized protein LOC113523424 [Galleria mellonella]|uniref:Uncharacterized protein LOC113523424 n=1 Tax=Galleria mellonella TaxID=7137 RepID=A0A6J1X6I1_GALME|nr:uncharacterized protein LOC113523424 [Galleria mellonella]